MFFIFFSKPLQRLAPVLIRKSEGPLLGSGSLKKDKLTDYIPSTTPPHSSPTPLFFHSRVQKKHLILKKERRMAPIGGGEIFKRQRASRCKRRCWDSKTATKAM